MTEDTETPPEPAPKNTPEHHSAYAQELEAKAKLTEVRRSFWDRLVMLGIIPLALALAPVLTSYLKARFDDSDAAIKKIEATIGVLDSSVNRLKEAVDDLAKDAQRRAGGTKPVGK